MLRLWKCNFFTYILETSLYATFQTLEPDAIQTM
jgi:hypothetical protein